MMKTLKLTLIIAVLAFVTANCKAQDYATLQYWGKDIKLDRGFFTILNSKYDYFMSNTARSSKYYDFKDYHDIYIKYIDNLTNPKFTIIVTEANQLQWRNAVIIMPGTDGEQGRSKKSTTRAVWLLSQVLLPSLQQFAADK